MHHLTRIVALALALGAGSLAVTAARPALAGALAGPLYPGEVRGLIFAAVMTAVAAGLIWAATRSLGQGRP